MVRLEDQVLPIRLCDPPVPCHARRMDDLLDTVARMSEDVLHQLREQVSRRVRELSMARGQIVFVMIEQDPLFVVHADPAGDPRCERT